MKKKLLTILLVIFTISTCLFTFTACGESQSLNYNLIITEEYDYSLISYSVIDKGTCTDKEIIIPTRYQNLPVTRIGNGAFYNCSTLTGIVIPNSVTHIGYSAFSGCPIEKATMPTIAISSIPTGHLKTVVINGGTSIGVNAFAYCGSLTSVTIGNSVTSIGNYAFYNCSSLTRITIPNSVTSIGDYAFSGCVSLTNIKYCGTSSEWLAIRKGTAWDYNTGNYTITYNYAGE